MCTFSFYCIEKPYCTLGDVKYFTYCAVWTNCIYYFSIFVLELIVFRAVEANTLLKYTHWSVARKGAKLQMQHASLGSTKCENVFDHTAQLCTLKRGERCGGKVNYRKN
jgi:hypothetical protein